MQKLLSDTSRVILIFFGFSLGLTILPQAIAQVTPATGGVSSGTSYTLALKSDGTVYSWGINNTGQLGLGNTTQQSFPVAIPGLTSVAAVVTGDAHSLALRTDGTVRSWGKNTNGQLGDASTTQRNAPVTVSVITSIISIAAGDSHSLALKSDGTVWAWGLNTNGQLGDNSITQRTSPVQVKGVGGTGFLTGITSIAAGASHSLARKSDGTVYAWGLNTNGQLGDSTTSQRNAPVLLAVGTLSDVTSIAAGDAHSVALKGDGTVRAWGLNTSGQLGDATTTRRTAPVTVSGLSGVSAITAGDNHTLALKSDGSVRAWGQNSTAQLGDGSTVNRTTAVQIPSVSTAIALAAGTNHTHILLTDGRLLSYGDNTSGQLGDGLISPTRFTAVQPTTWSDINAIASGASHTLAVRTDGSLWTWGLNTNGQLGDATTTTRRLPVQITTVTSASRVAAGASHSLALRTDGTVRTWGLNTNGQLGDGSTTQRTAPVSLSTLTNITAIAAGDHHSLARKSDGTLWVWGRNTNGQLGDGATAQRTAPFSLTTITNVSAIAAGNSHSLALKADGTVWAWGLNTNGQLGDASTTQRTAPIQVKGAGGTGFLTGVTAIAAAGSHSLALKSDGTLWSWGLNTNGRLGDNSTTQRTSPVQVRTAASTFLTGVSATAAGETFSLAVLTDGTVRAWGLNTNAQLGNGTLTQSLLPVPVTGLSAASVLAAGDTYALALRTDKTLRAWGNNLNGSLGAPSLAASAAALSLKTSSGDNDADGLPDTWETTHWGNLTAQTGAADPDADGLTNVQEYLRSSIPTQPDVDLDLLTDPVDIYPADYYNNVTPTLAILGGNNQAAGVNQFNPAPFDVAVWNAAGTMPLVNAPVTFSVLSGGGQLAASSAPPLSTTLVRRTDIDGSIDAFYQQPAAPGTAQIRASAGAAQVTFNTTAVSADSEPPSIPSGLAASALTSTSFTLTWTPSTDNASSASDLIYDVYLGGVLRSTTAAGVTSYSVTGLAPLTGYSMTVRARDPAGNVSAQSSGLVVTTTADTTAPSVPSGLASSSITMTGFTLTWAASTDDVAVSAYDVYRGGVLLGSTPATPRSFTVTGLVPSTASAMTVRARDAVGNASAQSSAHNVNTLADTQAPTVPGAPVLTTRTANTISLSWTAATDNHQVASYELYDGPTLLATILAPATTHTATGLSAATLYSLRLRAKDVAGNSSAYNATLAITTLGNGAPATIPGLRAWYQAGTSPVGALASWLDVSGNDHHATQGAITQHPQVVAAAINGQPVVRFDGADDFYPLPAILSGATQGEIYVVNRLANFDNIYNGLCQFGVQNGVAYSQENGDFIWEDFGINDGAPFSGPGSVVLLQPHIYNASISAAALSTVRFDGRVIKVRQGSQVDFTSSPLLGNDAYNEYYKGDIAEVLVFDRELTSTERDQIYFYLAGKYAPPGIIVPATPVLAAYAVSSTVADLSWTTANGGDQYVVATLERQIGAGAFTTIATLNDQFSYTDTALSGGQTYSYRVKLAGYAGESTYSAAVTITTPSGVSLPVSTGLRLWLRSTTGLPPSGDLNEWQDQSGLGNHATQAQSSQRPVLVANAVNGRPALRFDHTQNQHLALPDLMSGATAGEAFVLLRRATTPGHIAGLWQFGPGSGSRYPEYTNQIQDDFASTEWTPTDAAPGFLSDFHLYNVGGDSTQWFQRLNGTVYSQRAGNTVAFTATPNIGMSGVPFAGDIAEILVYDRVLTAAERMHIEHYLSQTYSLGWSVLDLTPPTTPGRPDAELLSTTSIRLTWAPSYDDTSVVEYRIYNFWELVGTSSQASIDLTGLNPGTLCKFTVQAVDFAGKLSQLSESREVYPAQPWPYANNPSGDPDGDGVPNYRDALPANAGVGTLFITITNPQPGSTF